LLAENGKFARSQPAGANEKFIALFPPFSPRFVPPTSHFSRLYPAESDKKGLGRTPV